MSEAIFQKYELLLENGRFIEGELPTQADNDALKEVEANLSELTPGKYPHLFGWYCVTYKFHADLRAKWPAASTKAAAKKDEVDEMDLFGDDDEEDAEAAKKAAQAAKDKAKDGKKKKQVIAMSLVMLEVKPLDDTTNLDDLAQKLFSEITQEGLYWKTEYKKEPVAFGIFKLIVGFSLEDEKVSVDGIVERIEGIEDMVQSVEIAAFNKI